MENQILELISEHFGIPASELTPSSQIRSDLNATDLEIADFFQILESTFKLTIPKEDVMDLQTVEDITSYIQDNAEEITNN